MAGKIHVERFPLGIRVAHKDWSFEIVVDKDRGIESVKVNRWYEDDLQYLGTIGVNFSEFVDEYEIGFTQRGNQIIYGRNEIEVLIGVRQNGNRKGIVAAIIMEEMIVWIKYRENIAERHLEYAISVNVTDDMSIVVPEEITRILDRC